MNEEKRYGTASTETAKGAKESEEKNRSGGSRARNRTVMLTPEMTGQVRAMLYQEPDEERRDPVSELLSPTDWSRPESSGSVSVSDVEPNAGADFGRDFSGPNLGDQRPERSSTGKIDLDVVAEAVEHRQSSDRDQGRRPVPSAGFSVNPHAAARPGMSGTGVARRATGAATGARIAAPVPTSKIVGFLISFDKESNGEVHEIRAGRWLVTSRATDHGEYILINDETISPLHAIVRATKDGKVQILDQLSEFGTGVTRTGSESEEEVAGAMVNVDHGDVLRLGQRRFIVCLIPKVGDSDKAAE